MKYLSLPIKSELKITEGWIKSAAERAVHKYYLHKGVDFETKYGEPVYASADGIATSSYHRFPVNDELGLPVLYKNKPISNGLGLFIQIYHPEEVSGIKGGTITQYGHLSKLNNPKLLKKTPSIAYDMSSRILRRNSRKRKNKIDIQSMEKILHKQELLEKRFPWMKTIFGFHFTNNIDTKESYLYTPEELNMLLGSLSPYVMKVKRGEIIGYTGSSGIFYGNCPYNEETFNKIAQFENTWDEIHLHFEVAQRDWESGVKINQTDPFNIYKSFKWYTLEALASSEFIDKQ